MKNNFDIIIPPMPQESAIIALLDAHSVPLALWGAWENRSLDDFLKSLTKDKVFIRNSICQQLVIDVHTAVVVVLHQFRGKWLELYEDHQLFPDGSVLRRTSFNGVGETLKRYEKIRDGAIRCLAEELSFKNQSLYNLSKCLGVERREPVNSEKWPGIKAAYHRYFFECTIARPLYCPNGYMEHKGGRKIFFKWKPFKQEQLNL